MTALLAAGLVGCSATADPTTCNPTTQHADALSAVEVRGSTTAEPQLQIRTPFHVSQTSSDVLEWGDGTPITSTDQLAVLDITLASGETGEPLIATSYDGDTSRVFAVSEFLTGLPGLAAALECMPEGTRLVVGLTPDDLDPAAAASIGLGPDDSTVAVVDVRKVYLPRANGAEQFVESHGLPTVVRAADGRPGIVIPDATAPDDVVVQTLLRGDGDEVTDPEAARVHYTSVLWDSGDVFETTWDTQPESLASGRLPDAVLEAVEGATVGSQLLVVVPADEGGSAQVYVVDILGTDG